MKYISLLGVCLILGGCGSTGRLLGNVTMLPVRLAKAATYQDGTEIPATDITAYSMGNAASLHHLE